MIHRLSLQHNTSLNYTLHDYTTQRVADTRSPRSSSLPSLSAAIVVALSLRGHRCRHHSQPCLSSILVVPKLRRHLFVGPNSSSSSSSSSIAGHRLVSAVALSLGQTQQSALTPSAQGFKLHRIEVFVIVVNCLL
ncbi:hypothetical protein PanWU01x14_159440 [Parasponia andersonii]|uniref:Uncharacterized protein n=1 Tax=Parasponia andersonii TaxID=3476 RepID=A0A2P5CEK9_PARAD|nr:hypothetical protein PanWU01x14_159440 [Parasponia andersonii]